MREEDSGTSKRGQRIICSFQLPKTISPRETKASDAAVKQTDRRREYECVCERERGRSREESIEMARKTKSKWEKERRETHVVMADPFQHL